MGTAGHRGSEGRFWEGWQAAFFALAQGGPPGGKVLAEGHKGLVFLEPALPSPG